MEFSEKSFLLYKKDKCINDGLSVFFATVCVIDVFGVFPLIALPKTILKCGPYGIFVVIVVSTTQICTAVLLGKCWLLAINLEPNIERKNRYPYSALAEFTYGKKFSKCVIFLLNITIFGGGIPNIIVASQQLELLGIRLTSFDFSYCYLMMAVGAVLCPILWLGSPKDMKLLCMISVIAVIIVFSLVTFSINFTNQEEELFVHEKANHNILVNVLVAYGVLVFQFDIHPTVLTILVDMKDRSKINWAILGGFSVTLSMFAMITIVFWIQYGTNVKDTLLESLPISMTSHVAVVFVAFQLGLSLGITNTALYQCIEDYMGIPREFNLKRCALRSFLMLLAILLAEIVPRFELIMSLLGGIFTGPLVYVFPPLFYVKLLILENKRKKVLSFDTLISDPSERESPQHHFRVQECVPSRSMNYCERVEILLCFMIICFGVLGTIATTYANVFNSVRYSSFAQPCIYNVSYFSK